MPTKQDLARLNRKLTQMARDRYKTPEYKNFYSLRLTRKRAAFYVVERSHFVLNRRQCWSLAAAFSPFNVKQLVWEHESDELMGDRERGLDNHYELGIQEGAVLGLKRKDFMAPPSIDTQICTKAWIALAQNSPWIKAVAASGALEVSNSDDVVGKGGSRRFGERMEKDLGIPLAKQASNAEHVVAEIEHANLVLNVASKHMKTKEDEQLILDGARESWDVNQVWLGMMYTRMAAMPGPRKK